ncbi:MAG TPA: DsbA family protein, partial [Rudaea sp.]|nr:DsbA family protein [Rudaea sp.]
IPLRFPPAHPFNPLAALRLCVAAGSTWQAVEAIFAAIWRDGRDVSTAAALADVARNFGIDRVEDATNAQAVKDGLRANTDAALAAGVFGVPTLRVGAELFWGNDASPMIDDWLAHPHRFATPEYARLANLPVGVRRTR